ncbi:MULTISPECIES: alpha/beta fold hydrolase [Gammaproteobacteria]|uniref:alpha/beta fold hydrolase n=1 Tax=Gammaproteobacteria TaxID=1236 RepID=UPI000DD0AA43|nr:MULTISPECIES: alpha/beta hydrolase [Gammaproteobacteria]RTE85779.1 alpha/beta hydrolase [Aliidiomarina sp. B3213]TCZ90218.1 alpha/beta hydrolase [Lysobacter sp. N42]
MTDRAQVEWQTWEWRTREGFTLRGQHTTPRGLPILHFIHGNSYCGLIYAPLWHELQHHFDIFLHDAQGHGDSDHGEYFVGWERSAELAVEVWRAHKPRFQQQGEMPEVIGMGHSFGGVLTTAIQAQYPDMFSRLMLLDPIVMPPAMVLFLKTLSWLKVYHKNPHAKRAGRRRASWPSQQDALQALNNRGMHKGWTPEAMEAFVQHGLEQMDNGEWHLKCKPSREAEIFSSYFLKIWSLIPRVKSPVDIFVGEDTYPFLWRSMRKWKKVKPQTRIVSVEGGHCFMQQHPQFIAQEIVKTLQVTS